MYRKIFTAIATLMGFLAILLAAALTLPTANAVADTGGARLEPAAERPPEDPARGLTFQGIEPGPADGPCEGLFELRSEKGELEGCTHGPDPSAADVDVRAPHSTEELEAAAPAGEPRPGERRPLPPVPCIEEFNGQTGNRVQAIYAYPEDLPGGNRYAQVAQLIRSVFAPETNQVFYESAQETGGHRHIRFVTSDNCELVVDVVRLSQRGDDDFANTIKELRGRGYTRSDRKYLVWMDANPTDGFSDYCGIGDLLADDSAGKGNLNDGNSSVQGMFARIDPQCWGGLIEAHELMHTMGGVQSTAPNATPKPVGNYAGGHCTDESDLMCYDDDGLEDGVITIDIGCGPGDTWCMRIREPIRQVCEVSHEELFDCNHDDYFHTAPANGSYLDSHWNAADSSFLSGQYFDRDGPEITAPVHELVDPVGPTTLPYSLTWSARDASGIREFHLWQYKENLNTPGAWSTSLVIPSGAGQTGNWVQRSVTLPLAAAHGYKFAVRAVDWAGNTSGWVYGDYFWVSAFDETNAAITFSGSWSQATSSNHFGGGTKRTNVAGSQASLTFYGSFIAWAGTLDPSGGGADVYLDGAKVANVSQTASSPSYRRVLFSKRYQCPPGQCGTHTITIRAAGGGVDTDVLVVEENGS